MAAFQFDDSRWPLLTLKTPRAYTHEEFLAQVAQMRVYLRRGERFGILNDTRNAPVPNAAQRQLMAETLKEAGSKAHNICALALVLSSPIQAAVVTGIGWFIKFPYSFESFSTMQDAERWLLAELQKSSAG